MKMNRFPADLSTDQINRLRNRFDTKTLVCLIIDKISYASPNLLAQVDNRMRQLLASPEIAFGGIAVILIGDFYQLPPVNAKNLFPCVWRMLKLKEELSSEENFNPTSLGTIEFSKFVKFELIQQMRVSGDVLILKFSIK